MGRVLRLYDDGDRLKLCGKLGTVTGKALQINTNRQILQGEKKVRRKSTRMLWAGETNDCYIYVSCSVFMLPYHAAQSLV